MSRATVSQQFCNRCGRHTNHALLCEERTEWEDKDDAYHTLAGYDQYYFYRCVGCDDVHFRNDSYFSEDTDEEGNYKPTSHFHPPRQLRRRPRWLVDFASFEFHNNFVGLLNEIYSSFESKSYRLAAMGIRSVVERMIILKVGDNGTFEANITAFIEAGYIARVQEAAFRGILVEAGHAAMHRDFSPSENDINVLLDTIESLLAQIYIYPQREGKFSVIPPRKPASKKSKAPGGTN